MVDRTFPDDPRGPDAFRYALELYLRSIPNLEAIDGFTLFNVVKETSSDMRIVALCYVLPSSELPIEVAFRIVGGAINYRILLGSGDEEWEALSEAKRWKAVYLYANEDAEPEWNWSRPIEGSFDYGPS